MTEFNRMTIVAAAELISGFKSHSDMEVLEVQWGINGRCNSSSKAARVVSWAEISTGEEDVKAMTENGLVTLGRALVEIAINSPNSNKQKDNWKKFVAGLRFDGFEIIEEKPEGVPSVPLDSSAFQSRFILARMLPDDIPGLDFREAESEVVDLLIRHGFDISLGHLRQAVSAFQRGEWSSANGELRNFYESYLNEIADDLGFNGDADSRAKRDFLGGVNLDTPFLFSDYNEWHENNQKPQFVQGLMSRMHPHGGHPGLSEEEDATFRLQISLVTARLFLRRYSQRKAL